MAKMVVGSAFVQELVSRGISYVLAKREEKASQGNLMERLEMAASELEFALERAMELPIRHLSLLWRRKIIKSAYVEAMELLEKHKEQVVCPGQEVIPQGASKRKRWVAICPIKNKSMSMAPFAGLSIDDVERFERCANFAGKFVRDLESGCSLHHYTFCNPMVRHVLEGKTLSFCLEQGNLRRDFCIWPTYSDERGMEAVLGYIYENSTVVKKSFILLLILRLSESTDIVWVAMKGLQFLTSRFKLAAECAIGELSQLSNSPDIVHSYAPPCVGMQEWHMDSTEIARPDPACCKGSRHGLCADNNTVSSGLADIFSEQVIYLFFHCYISAPESSTRRTSSDTKGGRSKTRGGKPPLVLRARFAPHHATGSPRSFAVQKIGDAEELRGGATIQQVAETLESNVTNCFSRQPELTTYEIYWGCKHSLAWFVVEKSPTTERAAGASKTRRYNTRGSTRRSSRR